MASSDDALAVTPLNDWGFEILPLLLGPWFSLGDALVWVLLGIMLMCATLPFLLPSLSGLGQVSEALVAQRECELGKAPVFQPLALRVDVEMTEIAATAAGATAATASVPIPVERDEAVLYPATPWSRVACFEFDALPPPRFSVIMVTRVFTVLSFSSLMRVFAFLVTQLPAPAFFCQAGFAGYNPPKTALEGANSRVCVSVSRVVSVCLSVGTIRH